MTHTPRARLNLAFAAAFLMAHGAADARSVTVSAGGGPGGLFITPCTGMVLSQAATDCIGFDNSYLSVERTNTLMDVWSAVLGRTAWTDPFSGITGPTGRPYTPFVQHTDTLVGAGEGSENSLFDASFGVSADDANLVGSLTLLRDFNGPFILGFSGNVVGTAVDFSGIFLYTGSSLAAGERIDFALPNVRFTFPTSTTTISGCGGGGIVIGGGSGPTGPGVTGPAPAPAPSVSIPSSSSSSGGCTPPPPPSYAIRLTGATVFQDPGYRVPVSGTLGLALAGLAWLGWNRRQRAAAIAAR